MKPAEETEREKEKWEARVGWECWGHKERTLRIRMEKKTGKGFLSLKDHTLKRNH